MGTSFLCRCLDCSINFKILDGGGFSYAQLLCDGCGKSISIPRYAPNTNSVSTYFKMDKAQSKSKLNSVLAFIRTMIFRKSQKKQWLSNYLNDRKNWVRFGRVWKKNELDIIRSIVQRCDCGGNWGNPADYKSINNTPSMLHRCPSCLSKNYQFKVDLSFD